MVRIYALPPTLTANVGLYATFAGGDDDGVLDGVGVRGDVEDGDDVLDGVGDGATFLCNIK